MSTVSPPVQRVKVVALLTRQREQVLIDEALTLDTLALLQPVSPLSRAFLEGAGMPSIPKGIAVYVDGKRLWVRDCPHWGATDLASATRKTDLQAIPFTDAFGDDYDDERLAENRAAAEFVRNDQSDRDDADEWVADVLEQAGSQRPKLRPTPPELEPVVEHAPCPCPTYGKRTTPLGLPYRPVRQVRKTDKGVEMLLGHDFATL